MLGVGGTTDEVWFVIVGCGEMLPQRGHAAL